MDNFESLPYNEKTGMMEIPYVAKEPMKPLIYQSPIDNEFDKVDMPAFLMNMPNWISNDCPNNVWIEDIKNERAINKEIAIGQWTDLYNIISRAGHVYLIPSKPGLQDLIYTANMGFMMPPNINFKNGKSAKNTFILSNFRSTPRVGEALHGFEYMKLGGFNVIQPPFFFEGWADLKLLYGNVLIGYYGIRTDNKFYDWLEQTFDVKVIRIKGQDQYLYHGDCNFMPIDSENTMVYCDGLEEKEIDELEEHTNILDIDEYAAYSGTTNSIRAGNIIINASLIYDMKKTDADYWNEIKRTETLVKEVEKCGLSTIFVNINELTKSGALTSCCSVPLNYVGWEF